MYFTDALIYFALLNDCLEEISFNHFPHLRIKIYTSFKDCKDRTLKGQPLSWAPSSLRLHNTNHCHVAWKVPKDKQTVRNAHKNKGNNRHRVNIVLENLLETHTRWLNQVNTVTPSSHTIPLFSGGPVWHTCLQSKTSDYTRLNFQSANVNTTVSKW